MGSADLTWVNERALGRSVRQRGRTGQGPVRMRDAVSLRRWVETQRTVCRFSGRNARRVERGPVSVEPLERLGRGLVVTWRRSLGDLQSAWVPARQTRSAVYAGALLLLLVSAVFGGASQTNALSLMAVELASLPLLVVSIYLIIAGEGPAGSAFPVGLLAAIVLVPVLQIIPLPFDLWRQLPEREVAVQALGYT